MSPPVVHEMADLYFASPGIQHKKLTKNKKYTKIRQIIHKEIEDKSQIIVTRCQTNSATFPGICNFRECVPQGDSASKKPLLLRKIGASRNLNTIANKASSRSISDQVSSEKSTKIVAHARTCSQSLGSAPKWGIFSPGKEDIYGRYGKVNKSEIALPCKENV